MPRVANLYPRVDGFDLRVDQFDPRVSKKCHAWRESIQPWIDSIRARGPQSIAQLEIQIQPCGSWLPFRGNEAADSTSRCRTARGRVSRMRRTFTAVVERDTDTGFYIGIVPGIPGAHTQAASLDELNRNLKEVVEMLLEDGEPNVEAEFVGTQLVEVS